MPRKIVYVSNQSPKDLMAGLLEIVQNQGGDNHLTVSCMRAMNKYITTNLRQSNARVHSHDSKRSTRRRICRICGRNLADMANSVPDAPQSLNDSHNCEAIEVDDQPRAGTLQVDLDAPVANGTATQPANEEHPSTEGRDGGANSPPQQPQSGAVAGDAPTIVPSSSDHSSDSDYLPSSSDSSSSSSSGSSSQSPPETPLKTASDPIPKLTATPIQKVKSSPISKASLIRKLTFSPLRKFVSKAIAEAEPTRDENPPRSVNKAIHVPKDLDSDATVEELSPPPRALQMRGSPARFAPPFEFLQSLNVRDVSKSSESDEETEEATDEATDEESSPPPPARQIRGSPTRFAPPGNVNQSFIVPNDSDSSKTDEATDEEPTSPPRALQIRGSPTRFAPPGNVNQSFMVRDDSDPGSLSSPSFQLGSSPPVISRIPESPVSGRGSVRNTPIPKRGSFRGTPYPTRGPVRDSLVPSRISFRNTPVTTSFHQTGFPSDGSEANTEKDAQNSTKKSTEVELNNTTEKARPAGYRTFLELIKGSLGQPFNPDETLTSSVLGSSSPCAHESGKAKESSEVKIPKQNSGNDEETDSDDTEEETYDDDLINRSLITQGPNPRYVNPRPVPTPPSGRPHTPIIIRTPIILPTITLTDTDTKSEQNIEFQNTEDPNCGIEYRRLGGHAPELARNSGQSLSVPSMNIQPRATRHVPSRRPLAASGQKGAPQPGPSNLRQPKRARDDDQEHTAEPRKRIRFAFGTSERDAEFMLTRSGPRVWFKDGVKYYEDPEQNPNATGWALNQRPGINVKAKTVIQVNAKESSPEQSDSGSSEPDSAMSETTVQDTIDSEALDPNK